MFEFILGSELKDAVEILNKLSYEYNLIETKSNNSKFDEYLGFQRIVKILKKDKFLDVFYSKF